MVRCAQYVFEDILKIRTLEIDDDFHIHISNGIIRYGSAICSYLVLVQSLNGIRSPRVSLRLAGATWQFPEQFSARLDVVSHMVDRGRDYPPWIREMDIAYDYAAGRAKVVVKEGLNSGKTFLRLYGSKKEYMIREGEFPSCRRSYLGE